MQGGFAPFGRQGNFPLGDTKQLIHLHIGQNGGRFVEAQVDHPGNAFEGRPAAADM